MHVSFRLFLPTCITQKLILSSSKLPMEPTGAVYHIREEERHLFGLWATSCNCMSTESSNSTGCLQIRRVGRTPKQACFMADGPSMPFRWKQGWRKAYCGDGATGWQEPHRWRAPGQRGHKLSGACWCDEVWAPFITLIPLSFKAGELGVLFFCLIFLSKSLYTLAELYK